ncbi:ribosomal protein S5 domain 2-like protein [Pluteus cervinus]|uniref:Ribosomal protein S5 domain 2-like protein n=1 Tax=Pluteus cervinus TaxID=181527 RepID=A0ACD3AH47_9AGAR|nr:ribosomal protein S5 domain 2-like protein [Pluteus cervinus]
MTSTRRDGRSPQEYRPIGMSFDGLARADGSARFGFSTTTALASVSGPIEVKSVSENPSQALFEVLIRPLSNVPGTEAKSMAAIIRGLLIPSLLLGHNPRTLIQLVIQSLSSPRGVWKAGIYAAMINASTLALLNAGSVPMRGVICAIPVARIVQGQSTVLVVDPSEEEEAAIQGGGCFAFMFAFGLKGGGDTNCVWANWSSTKSVGGVSDELELVAAKELAKKAAKSVWDAMKERLDPDYLSRMETDEDGDS